jgi:hypothetical protein
MPLLLASPAIPPGGEIPSQYTCDGADIRSGTILPFKKLFIHLSNVALNATEFFRIPVNRIVELGGQIEL